MIHFNALDFNVCRSEEVMFLLTLSVVCDIKICKTLNGLASQTYFC